jgi:hypothetical protein
MNCPPGQCPLVASPSEARRLGKEFEFLEYLQDDGSFRTTQEGRIGNIRLDTPDAEGTDKNAVAVSCFLLRDLGKKIAE